MPVEGYMVVRMVPFPSALCVLGVADMQRIQNAKRDEQEEGSEET